MASPNARIALQSSETYRILEENHREPWLNEVMDLGDRASPVEHNEEFEDPEDCLERLNDWGFAAGHRFITGRSRGTDRYPSWQFRCMFYGTASQNNRRIEDEVVRDQEGKITPRRQRDTSNHRLGCPAKYGLSQRVSKESGETYFIGRWIDETHAGHPIPMNPYDFTALAKRTANVQQLQQRARFYR